jgi:hypothetical protein
MVTNSDSTVTLPPDTLKPAGSIKGVIRLSEGGDPRKVFVLAFGIDRFARVEEDGSFRFTTLAEAEYDLRIISSIDHYGVLDTVNIPVISADTTNLDTLELPYTGNPTVKGLSLTYDTLKQIVTLTWNQADTGLVNGYNVYRQHVDSGLVQLNAAVVTDTVFRDSTAVQDNSYTYQVKAVDKNGNEGMLDERAAVTIDPVAVTEETIAILQNTMSSLDALDGRIYVATPSQDRKSAILQIYDTLGHLHSDWNMPTELYGDRTFNSLVAPDPNIIVVVDARNRIWVFDSLGNTTQMWSVPYTIIGVAAYESYVYLGDIDNYGRSRGLHQYSLTGDSIATFGTDIFSGTIHNVVADENGDIYVSETYPNLSGTVIHKFKSSGMYDRVLINTGTTGGIQFDVRHGLIFYSYSRLRYLHDTDGMLICRWKAEGYPDGVIGDTGQDLFVVISQALTRIHFTRVM